MTIKQKGPQNVKATLQQKWPKTQCPLCETRRSAIFARNKRAMRIQGRTQRQYKGIHDHFDNLQTPYTSISVYIESMERKVDSSRWCNFCAFCTTVIYNNASLKECISVWSKKSNSFKNRGLCKDKILATPTRRKRATKDLRLVRYQ